MRSRKNRRRKMEKFKIAEVPIAGKIHYQVYELIDEAAPDTEENRKKIGGTYAAKWCATSLASILNREATA